MKLKDEDFSMEFLEGDHKGCSTVSVLNIVKYKFCGLKYGKPDLSTVFTTARKRPPSSIILVLMKTPYVSSY